MKIKFSLTPFDRTSYEKFWRDMCNGIYLGYWIGLILSLPLLFYIGKFSPILIISDLFTFVVLIALGFCGAK